MPTLLYLLFVLVVRFTQNIKEHNAWKNFLVAIGIPLLGYLLSQTIFPMWRIVEANFGIHTSIIIIISSTLVFFFFLIRSLYILLYKKSSIVNKHPVVWKVLLTLVLPVIGLLLNNGFSFYDLNLSESGVFGNFSHPWFYVLVVLNGVLICLPENEKKIYRLVLLSFKSITLPLSLYFLLVFIPFFPFSVVLIVFFGLGFLMLTPLVVFSIHVKSVSADFKSLKNWLPRRVLYSIALLSLLVIPLVITVSFLNDRKVLNESLSYLYQPNYSKEYNIKEASLKRSIKIVKAYKSNNRSIDGLYGEKTPYIASYFNWLVLDNLTLSDAKIDHIENVFFGTPKTKTRRDRLRNANVDISNISSRSTFNHNERYWTSWIDLEITNANTFRRFSEYATTFKLPEGTWISNYYLYVGEDKAFGILAEKKSALWVFNQIRNENKDPGLLYYLTGNKVAFRVFPFSKNEVRKTGIQLIHKEPIEVEIDNHKLSLGNPTEHGNDCIESEDMIYVSSHHKKSLPVINRRPYFHFLIDSSIGKEKSATAYIKRIQHTLKTHPKLSVDARFSFVNARVHSPTDQSQWDIQLKEQTFENGFYLERAIQTLLIDAHKNNTDTYPVFVVVTDALKEAIVDKDFSDLEFAYPENDIFLNLDNTYKLSDHSLTHNPLRPLPQVDRECQFCFHVLKFTSAEGKTYYLPDNSEPSIILKKNHSSPIFRTPLPNKWESALNMQGHIISHSINPEHQKQEWLPMVRESFKTNIMNKYTSFIVVENEAQKQVLLNKQEEVLSGKKYLDIDNETQSMSEPGMFIFSILLMLILFRKKVLLYLQLKNCNN